MVRIAFLICSLCMMFAANTSAADKAAPMVLSAAQIVDRNVEARGGLAAWRGVRTVSMSGELDAGGKTNAMLPFLLRLKRPHMSRLELRFHEQTAVQVYDGTNGWKVRPFLNRMDVEPFTVSEAKAASAWDELDGLLLDVAAKGTKVELVGNDSIEGHPAYKLKLTAKGGETRHLWVDASTFLELKVDGEPRRFDGKLRTTSVFYRDFKTENGLTTPRVLETAVDGVKQTRKLIISRVMINEDMPGGLFAKPRIDVAVNAALAGK